MKLIFPPSFLPPSSSSTATFRVVVLGRGPALDPSSPRIVLIRLPSTLQIALRTKPQMPSVPGIEAQPPARMWLWLTKQSSLGCSTWCTWLQDSQHRTADSQACGRHEQQTRLLDFKAGDVTWMHTRVPHRYFDQPCHGLSRSTLLLLSQVDEWASIVASGHWMMRCELWLLLLARLSRNQTVRWQTWMSLLDGNTHHDCHQGHATPAGKKKPDGSELQRPTMIIRKFVTAPSL